MSETSDWKADLAQLEGERAAFEAGFWYGSRGSMGYAVPGLAVAWRDYLKSKSGEQPQQDDQFYRPAPSSGDRP